MFWISIIFCVACKLPRSTFVASTSTRIIFQVLIFNVGTVHMIDHL